MYNFSHQRSYDVLRFLIGQIRAKQKAKLNAETAVIKNIMPKPISMLPKESMAQSIWHDDFEAGREV